MFFFAKFKENNNEIIIFKTQEERDDWVNFKDDFSKDMGTKPENAVFQRMAITNERAVALAGDAFDNTDNYYIDEISQCLILCFSPPEPLEIIEERRYKIILDKFSELKSVLEVAKK